MGRVSEPSPEPSPEPSVDAADVAAAKAALRGWVRARRQERWDADDDLARTARADALASRVLRHPAVAAVVLERGTVAAYASFAPEPPTAALLDALVELGVEVLLPVVRPGRALAWARYDSPASLAVDAHGIPTPVGGVVGEGAAALLAAGVGVVLVPALAVGEDGRRLGQGGGFYDTVLAALPRHADGGPPRIAVVGEGEVLPAGAVPVLPHDQPVDDHVTG